MAAGVLGAVSVTTTRRCVVCGRVLVGLREDARHCSAACRAEASLLVRILSGEGRAPWPSAADRLAARRRSGRAQLLRVLDGSAPVPDDLPPA